MRSTEIFKIREVDSKLLARERNDVIRQLRRILPATAVSEVGSTAVEGVVGKQDLGLSCPSAERSIPENTRYS
jgi:hypothetical protein